MPLSRRNKQTPAERVHSDESAMYQGLLESAPDAIVVMGTDGFIRLVNRQTEVLFGYAREELIGQPVERLIPERLAAHHPDLRSGYFAAPSVRAMGANLELAARRKDGSEFPVDISLAPLETEEGLLVSAAVRDVTERKRAEAELREREEQLAAARDQALEASRLKSQFLANMSHEIRTPMNGVLGMAELILTGPLPPEQRSRILNLKESGESLLTIINDILDFSKMEAGKLELEEVDFNLPAAADSVLALLSSQANTKGLTLELDVEPDVPRWVRGDAVRLRQILLNLTGNGIKFTKEGGVNLTISRVGSRLRFTVSDTGMGIDPASKERLLEPFSQGDASTTRRFGGTGLGLAICQQLIDLMGGKLDFTSEPGTGSTFWFEIELQQAKDHGPVSVESAAGAGVPQSSTPKSETAHGDGRILLVDDVAINRVVGKGLLESLGYEVETVVSGAEAIARIESRPYIAILMDCLMPEMDGYETTRRVRGLGSPAGDTPIIALTAAAMSGDRERCLASGMDDYISKPLDVTSLQEALTRQIGRRSLSSGKPKGTGPARFPNGSPDAALVDKLAEFKGRFPAETFERICREFLSSTPRLISELDAAVRAQDKGSVVALAHKLKGSMSTFGALGLSDLAHRIEIGEVADGSDLDLVEQIGNEYAKASGIVGAQLVGGQGR
jgi:PAS domain S-box-containing protein